MSSTVLNVSEKELDELEKDFLNLEKVHKNYVESVNHMSKTQDQCTKGINHLLYRLAQLYQQVKSCRPEGQEEKELRGSLLVKMALRKQEVKNFQESLPKQNGPYLNIILGKINVTLMNKADRLKYKEDYERFKLVVTTIILILSFLNIVVSYRVLDSALHFLQVWYHCTLTIRESILVVNGSRIKGWWRTQQFLTTVQSGVIIVWPDGLMYHMFRKQFMWYTCYTSFLQFLQFYYQQGCLYRLRSLGERYNMDVTIEGFHSWMWRGLSFLLPFLYVGYMWQMYNAYTLYQLSNHPECQEWQVKVSALIFLGISLGNMITSCLVVHHKLREKLAQREDACRTKQQ